MLQALLSAALALAIAAPLSPPPSPDGAEPEPEPSAQPDPGAEPPAQPDPEPPAQLESEPVAPPPGPAEPEPVPEPEPESVPESEPEPEPVPEPLVSIPVEGDDVDDDEWDETTDSLEARQARRRIAGGGILIGVGLVVVGGSVGMIASNPCTRAAGNSCSEDARARAARTMAIPGVAITVAGAVLLALGVRDQRRVRASVATLRRGGALVLSGRF